MMFVTVKRYLTEWKTQREINDSLKEINASQYEAIAALQRRVDNLEAWAFGTPLASPPYAAAYQHGGGPGGEVPSAWSGRDANMGGLRWSDEHGAYIGPGGGSVKYDPHWKNTGMGGSL